VPFGVTPRAAPLHRATLLNASPLRLGLPHWRFSEPEGSTLDATPRSAAFRVAPHRVATPRFSTQRKDQPMFDTDISPRVRALADHLATASVGQTLTWPHLSAVAGADVTQHRHILYSAFKIAQRESGAVFSTERGVGCRRLAADEMHHVGKRARDHIRRTARRSVKAIIAGVRGANDITDEAKLKANAELASLGLIEHMARDRQTVELLKTAAPEQAADVNREMLAKMLERQGATISQRNRSGARDG
jgi:hypothetical protein